MTIATTITKALGRKPWKAPNLEAPLLVDERELGTPLGSDRRGHVWFESKWGELEERQRRFSDDDVLPLALLVAEIVDDQRRYRAFDIRPPGSHAATMSATDPGPRSKPPKPTRPVDLMRMHPELQKRSGRVIVPPSTPNGLRPVGGSVGGYRAPAEPPVGAAALVRWLARKGIRLSLANGRIVVQAPGGTTMSAWLDIIRDAAPLIRPHLAGERPLCDLEHDGEPPEAVTIAGEALVCPDHLAGRT